MLHLFDAYGTLLDVHAATSVLEEVAGARALDVSRHLRGKQLEYSWVRTLGALPWRDFRALTGDAFDHALASFGLVAPSDLKARYLAAYDRLSPFSDVEPALGRLRDAGARLGVFSNGSEAMLEAALSAAGLLPCLDLVISADEVRRYKTTPDFYSYACERARVSPEGVTFYSSNRWDVAAARRAGFQVTWVNRAGAPDEYQDCPPHRVVTSLDAVTP